MDQVVIFHRHFQSAALGSIAVDVDSDGNRAVAVIDFNVLRSENRGVKGRYHCIVNGHDTIGAVGIYDSDRSARIIQFLTDVVVGLRRRIDFQMVDIVFLFASGQTQDGNYRHSHNRYYS